jgi:hypothetical protein
MEKVVTATKKVPLGTRMIMEDGRAFRYCKAGEAIGAGMLCQTGLAIADHDMDLPIQAAAAVGATSISVTIATTAVTADQYADGYIYINDGAGEGHIYRIDSAHAAYAAGTVVIPLAPGDAVAEVLATATSLAGLVANPYGGALLYNTTPDGLAIGVAATEIASASYGWLQTWGWGNVLVNGTQVLGKCAVPGLTTSGSVDPHVSTGDAALNIGVCGATPISVTTDYGFFFLTIAP